MRKKILVFLLFFMLLFSLIFSAMFFYAYNVTNRIHYCDLYINDVFTIHDDSKQFVVINANMAAIKKTFASAIAVITEDDDESSININILAKYGTMKISGARAYTCNYIVLPSEYFLQPTTYITTGDDKRKVMIVKREENIFIFHQL